MSSNKNHAIMDRLKNLSPDKKALLEKLIKEKNGNNQEFSTNSPFKLISDSDATLLPVGIIDAYPVSSVQLGMLFHMEYTDGGISPADYHNLGTFRFKLRDSYNHDIFQRAVSRVVENQDNLRTSFDLVKYSRPLQLIHSSCEVLVEYLDLRGESESNQEKVIQEYIEEENHNTIDVTQLPLVRFVVHHLADHVISLSFTEPHSIADGWSVHLTFRDIFNVYFSYLDGEEYEFEVLKTSYSDFVEAEKKAIESEATVEFWDQRLLDCQETKFPTLTQEPRSDLNVESHRVIFELPKDVVQSLHKIVESTGIPLKAIFLVAHLKMLSIVTGKNKVTTGMSLNGRLETETGDKVRGLFLNTLPITLDMSEGSWIELCEKAHQEETNTVPHRRYPLGELQRKFGDTPIVNSLLGFLHFHSMASSGENERMELINSKDLSKTNFDITAIFVLDPNDKNLIKFIGDANLNKVTYSQYEDAIQYYKDIIQEIASSPNGAPRDKDFLIEKDKQKILMWSGKKNANFDVSNSSKTDRCIHDVFQGRVSTNPNGVAAIFENKKFTYDELNSRSNQLANMLIEKGIKKDAIVGIFLNRSIDMLVCLLGVLKSGGAYLPLDPKAPQSRITYMLEDSGTSFVLSETILLGRLSDIDAQVIDLSSDSINGALDSMSAHNIDASMLGLRSKNLAYVIYTSGSTGNPKGVMLEHKGLVNLADYQKKQFDINETSRVLQFASFSFDAATWDIVMTLGNGGTVFMLSEEQFDNPSLLGTLVNENNITHALLPPALLDSLTLSDWDCVQTLVVGGEACPYETAKRWSRNRDFYNAYGPTETTIIATLSKFDGVQLDIGSPVDNSECFVLDESGNLVPVGTAGELHVGGIGLARGYINRPNLTDEKFIETNGSFGEKTRLYRTGDLVRWLPNGKLEYVGRIDDQIKIRGFRVELGEINAKIQQLDSVNTSIVICDDSTNGQLLSEKKIVAYVVPKIKLDKSETKNRDAFIVNLACELKSTLPHYMVPSAFVLLPHLPLTLNGKIDKNSLPDVNYEAHSASAYVAPQTDLEKELCDIFNTILDVNKIGIDDDFFHLGGHSILAVRLSAHIRDKYEVEISLREIFTHPSVRSLALHIEVMANSVARPEIKSVYATLEKLPLSFSQNRLWFVDKVNGGSSEYNIPIVLNVEGEFDVSAAECALCRIIERHHSLRTVFSDDNEGPVQIVMEDVDFSINYIDVRNQDATKRTKYIREKIREDSLRTFDLAHDLMVRCSYMQTSDDTGVLFFNMHHIASDGWSIGVLVKEFSEQYPIALEQGVSKEEPLEVQYADYAHWQHNWLQGETLNKQIDYWQKQLDGIPTVHSLPLDNSRGSAQGFNGDAYKQNIGKNELTSLKRICNANNATLFMGLHAAFSILLSRYSNETDIVIGTYVANRDQKEISKIIGFFVNNLVLRLDLSGNPSFNVLLKESRSTLLDAYANQQVPFEQVVEKIQPERSLSHSPLFQIMLVLQNNEIGTVDIPGLSLTPIEQNTIFSKYDLTLNISESDEGLTLLWEYNTDLFEFTTVARMSEQFGLLVKALVANSATGILDVNMLSDAERHLQIVQWNDTALEYNHHTNIHQMFERQVAQSPQQVAVVSSGEKITYSELNSRVNQLAHMLHEMGVQPDSLVGICVERSINMLVGLLAILKAGGAYVPMDPSYPIRRLKLMIEDAQFDIMITQSEVEKFLNDSLPKNTICLDDAGVIQSLSDNDTLFESPYDLRGNNLAYMIYTSGSTGKPKGVLVEHGNVVNFFAALDQKFPDKQKKEWLALTSISFDISVLELFWTLTNGDKVVLAGERATPKYSERSLDFSLFYFAAEEANDGNKYDLLLEGAKFADQNNFASIWVPERHFHSFGDQFPNPSIAAAAVAATTKNIKIRSGSVVLPLHDTVRVAEEWSMVDNLSGGRVELSIASGWHPNDFVFFPENYENRHQIMREKITELNDLWKGNSCKRTNGLGQEVDIFVHPKPVQEQLTIWITAAGSPETFRYAGSIGANILTHLLGQSAQELKEKIDIYRGARAENGFDRETGKVALMIHTYLGENIEHVKEKVEQPFKNYLKHSIGLIKPIADEMGLDIDKDSDALVDMGYQRYFHDSGLFGTVDSVFSKIQEFKSLGVDECACLIDFGVDHASVLENLPFLEKLKVRVSQQQHQDQFLNNLAHKNNQEDIRDLLDKSNISHIQCTPSYVREIASLLERSDVDHTVTSLYVGGEALSEDLAKRLLNLEGVSLFNMYGPTETTVWSSITAVSGKDTYLSGPIANTRFYVLKDTQLVPTGVAGELCIGGDCVTRGYFQRDELTQERFVDNPFSDIDGYSGKIYRTGDLARWRADGHLEFLGRIDDQVKIRGFRIELHEIEQVLNQEKVVNESVVVARKDASGNYRLVAFIIVNESIKDVNTAVVELESILRQVLPEYMIPAAILALPALPLTPNGKVDRNALPDVDFSENQVEYHAPSNEMETIICDIWQEILGIEKIGINDNFFQLGGHSLQVIQLISLLREKSIEMSARQLFDTPTVKTLASVLGSEEHSNNNQLIPEKFSVPENIILASAQHISPEMLPLITLTQDEIDTIIERIPGGVGNVQDIYPLSPLQQGVFFHHQMSDGSDPYIMSSLFEVSSETSVDVITNGLQFIIDRHDVMRTSVLWEGLSEAVQVVCRSATLPVKWLTLNTDEPAQAQMEELCAPDRQWMEIDRAPLLRVFIALNPDTDKHFVLIQFHHTVSDHVGFEIIQKEIAAFKGGLVHQLPEPMPYRGFVAHAIHQAKYQDSSKFFTEMLGDISEPTLPFGLTDVQGDGCQISQTTEPVPDDISRRVRAIAKDLHISSAAIFHAAWSIVISNCSGSRDVVFGTVLSGRLQGTLGVENMMGVFVNTLPIRIKLDNVSATELIEQVQKMLLDLLPFEQASLAEAQTCSGLSGGTPLFSAIFNYRHSATERSEIKGSKFEGSEFQYVTGAERTNYPFEISVDDLGEGFSLDTQVDDAVCSDRITAYMQAAVQGLVEALEVNPYTDVGNISILPKQESAQQLIKMGGMPSDYSVQSKRIHELFEQQVLNNPDSVAAVYESHSLTYHELNRRANKVANYLVEKGVRNNTLVGIYAERSLDFLVAMMATMKAGGAYVPLDASNPAERLSYMVENAQAPVVLSQQHLKGTLTLPSECIEAFLDDAETFGAYSEENLNILGSEDDCAYMIYTSGSTGRPKGAMVHHAGAINHIYAEYELLGFMNDGTLLPHNFLQSAASSSDVSVWQFLAPVVSGGKTVILDNMTDMPKLVGLLKQENVHLIQTAPVVLQLLVETLSQMEDESDENARELPDLRWLMIIAEPCPVPLLNRWFELNASIPVMNGFGPTEASDDITYYIMREALAEDVTSIPIGKPIPNMSVYILDKHQQLLPMGVVGELCVSGVGVGPGYWQNPERNAQSFVDNPFKDYPGVHGERLYRTGDLARWMEDGELEFIGRIDHQVKIRGFRIELGEIEHQLSLCEGASSSTVIVREDELDQKRIVAYLVPDEAENLSNDGWVDQIRSRLENALPSYMLPSAYVVMEKFPLTPADKIDKKALPAPNMGDLQRHYMPPETETEKTLVSIWSGLLKLPEDSIGVTENFFYLGGNSILVVRLVAFVREKLEKELSIKTIFKISDIRGLSAELDGNEGAVLRSAITPVKDLDTLPLSFAQQRLWFIDKLDGESSQYNMPRGIKVSGKFDVMAAEHAMNRIILRHQTLRTVFIEHDELPKQIIQTNEDFSIQVYDFSKEEKESQQQSIATMINTDASTPFNLAKDLMVRVSYIITSDSNDGNEAILLFNMHHIASDGWSMAVLVKEFVQQYQSILNKEEDSLVPLDIQYSDYAYWQRQWLQGDILDRQLNYWQEQLQELPSVHSLPLANARPKSKQHAGDTVTSILDKSLSKRLLALTNELDITPFMLMHAAFSLLLSRHSNSEDIVLGTPVANRMQRELEPLIGFFVNTLVLRVSTNHVSLREYLDHIKQANIGAQENQDIPFELLVDKLQVSRTLQHTPIFQIMLILDNTEDTALDIPGVSFSLVDDTNPVSKFDISLSVGVTEQDGIGFSWVYDKSIFDRDQIVLMDQHLNHLLHAIAERPDAKLQDLKMLSPKEEVHLISELNQTAYQHPTGKLIHEQFEDYVSTQPDHDAIVFQGGKLSYLQVNNSANQLARYFQEIGIKPGMHVAIRVKRSADMVIAILAILKVGAAYVPFDPEHPIKRIQNILKDTGITFLLSDSQLSKAINLPKEISTVDIDKVHEKLASFQTHNLGRQPGQDDQGLAYIIYTSGSTGVPKGVKVNHATVSNFLHFAVHAFMPDHVEGAVVSSTLAFDATVGSLYPPLFCGKYIELLDDDENILSNLEQVLLHDTRSLLFKITPAHMAAIASKDILPENRTSQHVLVIAGEQLFARSLYRWKQDLLPNANFINEYGPTEGTVGTTTFHGIDSLDISPNSSSSVPIGRPLDNVKLFILDKHRNLLPKGAVGELYVGGAGVAVGYTDSRITQERFVNVNLGGNTERVYRTGDLVRYLADGNVEFIGRIDHQVKIRGFRIELGEIQHQLSLCEGVVDNVVIVREDEPGKKRLVAYYIADDEKYASADWIDSYRAILQENLPPYMVPSPFIAVDEIPLNVNGKVDKGALPRPNYEDANINYIEPNTKTEKLLTAVWAELLNIDSEKLSVESNFFELGGDSILSIQVVSRSARQGMHFTVKDLFTSQTIRRLSLLVKSGAKVTAPQAAVEGGITLLPIQKRFFSDETDLHHYNQSTILETPQGFDLSVLKAFIQKIVERHDALRLKFTATNESSTKNTWQAVHIPLSQELINNSIEYKESSSASFDDIEPYVNQVQASLNPEEGVLFKAAYIKSNVNGSGRLLFVIHHLVVDGVSWRVVLEDLEILYGQFSSGQPLSLPEKTSSYQQWSEWLGEYAMSKVVFAEREYWRRSDRDHELSFPGHFGVNNKTNIGDHEPSGLKIVRFSLDENITRTLLSDGNKVYRTQVSELLMAALVVAVKKFSDSTSLRVDMEGHGREMMSEDLDIGQTVGWFTTIFPFLIRIPQSQSIGDVICEIKEQYRVIPNKGIGFGLLKYCLEDETISDLPNSELVFNYLGQFDQVVNSSTAFSLAAETTGRDVSVRRKSPYPLSLNGLAVSDKLEFTLQYDTSRYCEDGMQRFLKAYSDALHEVSHHCKGVKKGKYTKSDFPLSNVVDDQLDRWQNTYQIEDLYPATGMQQGLLFHEIMESGSYVTQTIIRLGGVDTEVFRKAWRYLMGRHAIFRTAFIGLDEGNPHQVIMPEIELPFIDIDLSADLQQDQEAALEKIRSEDKKKSFNLDCAPLMRLTIVKLDDHSHEIIWANHHALLDGWSKPVVFREVLNVYQAFSLGRTPELENVRPYRDYAEWLSKKNNEDGVRFWRNELAGVAGKTPLPLVDSFSDLASESDFLDLTLAFTEAETNELQQFTRSTRTTLNVLVQAAWSLLLSRYSGERTIVFGATTSGRPADLVGVEDMVGLFINTLPVVVEVDASEKIGDWLEALHKKVIEREEYSYVSLAEIQSLSPLAEGIFDSLLVFENYPVDETIAQSNNTQSDIEKTLEVQSAHSIERTNFDICLMVNLGHKLSITLEVNNGLLSEVSLQRVANHFKGLILNLSTSTEKTLADTGMMAEDECFSVMNTLNPSKPANKGACIHTLFEAKAAQSPDQLAVSCNGIEINYGELNRKSNRLARHLIKLGVGSDALVGLCVDRSVDMVVNLMAILKCGGAYVPLDPNLPDQRLHHMVTDSSMGLVITQLALREREIFDELNVLCTDDETLEQQLDHYDDENLPDVKVMPNQLAYVIYTSGSTGLPKGVMIEHSALHTFLLAATQYLGLNERARWLALTTLSFDIAGLEVFGPLICGGAVYLCNSEQSKDPLQLASLVSMHDINIMQATPASWKLLLESGWDGCQTLDILCGGEALPLSLAEQLRPKCQRLVNCYGPTEATIWSHMSEVDISGKQVSLDGILDGYRQCIVDSSYVDMYNKVESTCIAPAGVSGELILGGGALARGYVNKLDLTDSKFIQGILNQSTKAERLYRTGDLVRLREDGKLDFLGRIDHQVKIRGFRIELGEIEYQINQFDSVTASLLLAKSNEGGEKQLIAYVATPMADEWKNAETQTSEESVFIASVRDYLEQHLPGYMIPSFFVVLNNFPISANGKVDRKLLPNPEITAQQAEHVEASTQSERRLVDIWKEVLGVQTLGVTDNFFHIGGDSMKSLMLTSKMREEGFNAQLKDVFAAPTIKKFASTIEYSANNALIVNAEIKGDINAVRKVPLLPWQKVFLEKRRKDPHLYSISSFWEVAFTVDQDILSEALRAVVNEHDALRMRFSLDGQFDEAYIHPIDDMSVEVDLIDVSHVNPVKKIEEMEVEVSALYRRLDLQHGPLIRVGLVKLGDEYSDRILFNVHHIVTDDYSNSIILDDLKSAYSQLSNAQPLALSSRSSSSEIAAAKMREFANSQDIVRELDYWLSIPWKKIRPPKFDHKNINRDLIVSGQVSIMKKMSLDETRLIKELSRISGISMVDLLIYSIIDAQSTWLDGDWFRLNVVTFGRDYLEGKHFVDLSRTVGWYSFTKFLFFQHEKLESNMQNLESIVRQANNIPNKGSGLRFLLDTCEDANVIEKLEPIKSYLLGQNTLTLKYGGDTGLSDPDESNGFKALEQFFRPTETVNNIYRIFISATIENGYLCMNWSYNENLYLSATIENLANLAIDSLVKLETERAVSI